MPGSPPASVATLGKCPGGNQVGLEDWGRAAAVVAGVKKWGAKNVRLVIPISDEGPWCGDPVTDPGVDRDSITQAIKVAKTHSVMVSPITGTGSSSGVVKLAADLAKGTGGKALSSTKPQDDMATSVLDIVKTACKTFSDCNKNGTPDGCDIKKGKSKDCDYDGTPDECQSPKPTCAAPDAGVPDAAPPDASVPDLVSAPDVKDTTPPDLAAPDKAPPDAPAPDLKDTTPDMSTPDTAAPDAAAPDTAAPDAAAPDTAAAADVTPDTASPDVKDTPPADIASTADTIPGVDEPMDDGGCDCRVGAGVSARTPWLLLLALLLWRRRRRG